MPHAAIPFRPHHRFAVPLPRSRRGGLVTLCFFAGSCNISFPRRCGGSGERSEPMGALMPHAALWVVQPCVLGQRSTRLRGFNAACSYSLSPPPPLRGPPPPLAQGRLFSYGMSASLPDTQDLAAAKSRRSVKGYGILASPIAMGEVASAASRWGRSCRTRLCGWCSIFRFSRVLLSLSCFNAARGFVGGAARVSSGARTSMICFNAARGFVGGAASGVVARAKMTVVVSMPHAALWVVQHRWRGRRTFIRGVSMPHAALWVVQHRKGVHMNLKNLVSMPHAALWVVQRK